MKITNVSCTQFAGAGHRHVSFDGGINVIYGKNESGKSTLVHLISRTLFQNARVDRRSDREFLDTFMPAPKRGGGRVGDFIDGTVTIRTDKGDYTLAKEWGQGADARCVLTTPDGRIREQEEIDALLKEALIYGEGVYTDMLFSAQSSTDAALRTILDATKKTEAKQEIINAVSQAFAESDGISVDAIEQAILAKIEEIEGKHWDTERQAPVRKAGRWANGLGEILKAYYTLEDAKAVLDKISELEQEADRAAAAYTAEDAAFRAAEEAYQRFSTFAGLLVVQSERKKAMWRIEKEQQKILEVLSKWPQLTEAVERAKALRTEREQRAVLDLAQAVNEVRTQVSAEDVATAALSCPDEAELSRVQRAQRERQMLENKLCGMNLNAAVQMLGGHTVEVTSLRTGEAVDITAGAAAITEAVLITVPGVMEMRLTPADVDVAALEAQMELCDSTIAATLGKYGVETVEALETRAKAVAAAKANIDHMNNQAARLLGSISLQQLETQVAQVPANVRPKAAIDAEIFAVCGGADADGFIHRGEAMLDNYAAEYGTVNELKIKAFDLDAEYKKAKETVAVAEDVPAEYAHITDPDAHLAALQAEKQQQQSRREAALTAKTAAASRLEGYRAELTGDPVADCAEAQRRLDEQKALLAHWRHIYEVFQAQKEKVHDNPTKDIADRFAYYLGVISDGRISAAFPEADKLNPTVYSGDTVMDYGKLSDGTKETVSLAFRLAVLDHLFPDGGGVIVFDDPFTDMDADRMTKACALVQECAKRHQVIFLTCREEYLALLTGNHIRF